ncbi:MAG: PIN domain-containing protein [Candidatus Omnitrophica bacterium]|nr:PIN domain-containing protein [Candidatus Omnitrophota bacterium]
MVYLDTHLVLWLYAGSLDLISKQALRVIEEDEIYISPIVELELQYLKESKKIRKLPGEIIEALHKEINLKVCAKDFPGIIRESLGMHWTRDPFDRIIVAHASLNQNKLLTKDDSIRAHYKQAVW